MKSSVFSWMQQLKAFLARRLGQKWLSKKTLFVKAVIYRCFSVIMTFLIVFMTTGSWQVSAGISIIDLFAKTALYYVFDISWEKFRRIM